MRGIMSAIRRRYDKAMALDELAKLPDWLLRDAGLDAAEIRDRVKLRDLGRPSRAAVTPEIAQGAPGISLTVLTHPRDKRRD